LGRIERLAAGECIPLQHPLDHATVRLRADSANFARGELVTLGDAMGVRIVSIDDSG
jgi:flagellar motor switch/type III secretory pathway protein FliN